MGRSELIRVHHGDPSGRIKLTSALTSRLSSVHQTITVVCVGSDRSTGDSLGPLVGTFLAERSVPEISIRGTLDEPVHAANLRDHIDGLDGFVIAVDAMLTDADNVGTVVVKDGPIKPGTGVGKTLPVFGNMQVAGAVNVGGFMEYFVLQNTQLSLVMKLARVISDAVGNALDVWSVTKRAPVALGTHRGQSMAVER